MRIAAAVAWLLALALAYSVGASTPATSADIASLERALAHRSPLQRSLGLSEFLLGLNPDNLEATLERVEAQAYWFDQRDHGLLMHAWVRFDSLAAVDWATRRPTQLQQRARIATIRALGFHDPAAARSMLETIDPEAIGPVFSAMVDGWAWSKRRDGLTSYLSQLPADVHLQLAISALATIILSDGVDELIAWVDPISANTKFKLLAFQGAVDAIAQIDPPRAAKWVDQHLGQPYAKQATAIITRRWFERDPGAAMDWLNTLPEESNRRQRFEQTFRNWVDSEPREARDWLMASTPDPAVDPAVRELVRRDFPSDPVAAMDWTNRIGDPALRSHVQVSAGRSWYEQDPDAFMAWLPVSGLESEIRATILNSDTPPGSDPTPIDAGS